MQMDRPLLCHHPLLSIKVCPKSNFLIDWLLIIRRTCTSVHGCLNFSFNTSEALQFCVKFLSFFMLKREVAFNVIDKYQNNSVCVHTLQHVLLFSVLRGQVLFNVITDSLVSGDMSRCDHETEI